MNWWLWLLVAIGGFLVLGLIVFAVYQLTRPTSHPLSEQESRELNERRRTEFASFMEDWRRARS